MNNEEIFWIICSIIIFVYMLYCIIYWKNQKKLKTKLITSNKNSIKNSIYANSNILYNELIEILHCHLIDNSGICLEYKNKSEKTIKYLICNCKLVNTVNDYVLSNTGKDLLILKDTGPIFTNSMGGGTWRNHDFDDPFIIKIEIMSIEIEYLDNTKIIIDKVGINNIKTIEN